MKISLLILCSLLLSGVLGAKGKTAGGSTSRNEALIPTNNETLPAASKNDTTLSIASEASQTKTTNESVPVTTRNDTLQPKHKNETIPSKKKNEAQISKYKNTTKHQEKSTVKPVLNLLL